MIARPDSGTRGHHRWPRLAVLVLLTAMFAFVGAPGSAVATPTYKYDVPAFARVDVHEFDTTEASPTDSSGAREASASPSAEARGTSPAPSHSVVATESGTIYRTGARTDGALTDPTGVSFRDSISSSADRAQVFKPNDKIWAVDTAKLPPGSVVRDGVPAGHVSVNATPSAIRAAVFDYPLLSGSGMKLLEDGSYRLPK